MPEPFSQETLGEEVLTPAGEAAWARLGKQLELASGFWLGFIFAASPAAAAILQRRAELLLRMRARGMQAVSPKTPGELRAVLPALLGGDPTNAGCVWMEAIRADPPAGPGSLPGPWTAAWDELLLRLNERREYLRRHFPGGLVLAAHPTIKPRAREAAPDLWSVRAIVVELPLTAAAGTPDLTATERDWTQRLSTGVHPDPVFALEEARRRASRGSKDPRSVGAALLRAVAGFLAAEEPGRAVELAREAVDLLRNAPPGGVADLATALAALSLAEEANGDLAAAAEHIEHAIKLKQGAEERFLLTWLDRAGLLALARMDLTRARDYLFLNSALSRRLVERYGETPEALRDLSVSLERVGDVRRASGDVAAAAAAYEESLGLSRRLAERYGETPESLRDLSLSLDRVGDVRRASGDVAAAAAAYEESLGLSRRLVERYGETPESLRDLSVSLERVGDVQRGSGDVAAAAAAYEESLGLRRRLVERYGETPQALLELSVSLANVEDAWRALGNVKGAVAIHEELRALQRHG